ncbi:MAG: class I SAM-dependent methyltransferase [Verrucomicrobia bacterium]|nr:class I SAM-dependent methyltransferase [Verrucomicrobiota bacterium]
MPSELSRPGAAAQRRLAVEFAQFAERAQRAEYIARRFQPHLRNKVLDVGCDQAVLRPLLPGVDYFGIDIAGQPDLVVDLEQTERLPFDDASFDCVVCSDVLEHLENIHRVFDELVRVTRRTIILSLPNNWANARRPLSRGRGRIGFYGLPATRPADRHRWFFSLEEARAFLEDQARRHGLIVREIHAMEKPRLKLLRWLRRLAHARQMRYLNRYAHTLWAVLEKE